MGYGIKPYSMGVDLSPAQFFATIKKYHRKLVLNEVYYIKYNQTIFIMGYRSHLREFKISKFPWGMPPDPSRMHWHSLHIVNLSKPLHSLKVVYAHV